MPPDRGRSGLGVRRIVRRLASPVYLAALVAIVGFAYLGQGDPMSYFALSLVIASIYITLALAWDLSSGMTGYLNFGLPFFFGLGAFTTGYFSWQDHVRSQPLLAIASLAVGLLAGFLFAFPTLRLRGPYFSLLSILLPLIATDVVLSYWTQLHMPTQGYYSIPLLGPTSAAELIVLSAVNALLLTGFFLLRDSHFGLVLRGIRDDEEALSAQGVRTFPYKLVVFTLASGAAGYAGAMYAMVISFAGPDTFQFTFLIFPILIVILGGTGEIAGSVLAGYVVMLLYSYFLQAFTELTFIVFTGAAILLVLFLPGGILRPLRSFIQFMRTPEPP